MKIKKILGIGLIPVFAFTFLLAPLNFAWAGLFKYVDENGKTHYTDSKAKIPRKYRDKGTMKKVRGVGDRVSKGGGSAGKGGGAEGAGGGAGGSESAKDDPDILSDRDVGLLKKANAFMKKEIDFSKNYKDNAMTPTGQRGFVAAFGELIPEKESVANELSKGEAPIVKEISGHFKGTLDAAKSNPVNIRKLSVANTIARLESEASKKESLITKVKKAMETSEQKKKEAAEKEAKEKEKAAAGKEPPPETKAKK